MRCSTGNKLLTILSSIFQTLTARKLELMFYGEHALNYKYKFSTELFFNFEAQFFN